MRVIYAVYAMFMYIVRGMNGWMYCMCCVCNATDVHIWVPVYMFCVYCIL